MHEVVMIGDLDPQSATTSQVFDGCANRTQIAAFMTALAWEKFVKGATVGLVAGVVLTVAVAIYVKKG